MSSSLRRTIGVAVTVTLMVALYVTLHAATWAFGDVFAAVGDGSYKVYSNSGVPKETITDTALATFRNTAGCAFDASGNLYTTHFQANKVVKFDGAGTHSVLQTIDTGATSIDPESIVFAKSGEFY